MRSGKFVIRVIIILLVLMIGNTGCQRKVPLNQKEFTALLIDMHRADGILAEARGVIGTDESRDYGYYNDVFRRYNITRTDFDSCMRYYSAQTVLFSQIYDVVIDSLNRQLTAADLILKQLKAADSVNLFPVPDTLLFDSCYTHIEVNIDSIEPGFYKFGTKLRFDREDKGKNNRITSFFVSKDGKDTLKVRNVSVMSDTMERNYNWSQYADSLYSRLVIRFVDADDLEKLGKRKGMAWNMELFKPYVSRETEKRLRSGLQADRRISRRLVNE